MTSIPLDQLRGEVLEGSRRNVSKLVQSIRLDGLQDPLVVMPTSDGAFQVLEGSRRLKAIRHLVAIDAEARHQFTIVPCVVVLEVASITKELAS